MVKIDFQIIVEERQNEVEVLQEVIGRLAIDHRQQLRAWLEEQNWPEMVNNDSNKLTDLQQNPGHRIAPQEGEQCQFCFCQPCVTSPINKQQWWPNSNAGPAESNNAKRKTLYRKFWTMLYHRGIWGTSQYLSKKDQLLQGARHDYARINGEIMPECALYIVRNWYPSPVGTPYMGHKWG